MPQSDDRAFREWYAAMARQYDLAPDPDDPQQFYDYRAAFRANARPDESGHWPSQFKREGHPNMVVGGFHVQTGKRVSGTPRATEQELVRLGWDTETAKRLSAMPEPRQLSEAQFNAIVQRVIASAPEGLSEQQFQALLDAEVAKAEKPAERSLLQRFTGDPGGAGISPEARQAIEGLQKRGPAAALLEGAEQGALQGVAGPALKAAGGVIARTIGDPRKGLLRLANGARDALRAKFPTLDLESLMLREGTIVPSSKGAVSGASQQANAAIRPAARAADAAGTTPIQPRELTGPLRKLYDEAVSAKDTQAQQAIVEHARRMRTELRGGLSIEGAHNRKSLLQQRGKSAMTSHNPSESAYGSQLANAEREAVVAAARQRAPEYAAALNRSQELKFLRQALEQAARSPASIRIPFVPPLASSPRALSVGAHAAAPTSEALVRAALISLMSSHDPEEE